MPNNLLINLPKYGVYSKDELVEQYGDDWEDQANKLGGSVSLDGYGDYSVSELIDEYGDDWESQVELINNPKKKEEEDTESVSEDGSLDSQETESNQDLISLDIEEGDYEYGDVSISDEELGFVDGFVPPIDYQVPSTDEEAERIGEAVDYERIGEAKSKIEQIKTDKKVDNYLANNPDQIFSSDLSDKIEEAFPEEQFSESKINQSISLLREAKFNESGDKYLERKRNSFIEENSDLGKEDAEISADLTLFKEAKEYGKSTLNLSDDELTEFGEAIDVRSTSLRDISILKNKLSSEKDKSVKAKYIEEISLLKEAVSLSGKKIASLRERGDVAFTDEEGNVNKDLKAKVESKVVGFEKEYKSDYKKILERLIKEKAILDNLPEEMSNTFKEKNKDELFLGIKVGNIGNYVKTGYERMGMDSEDTPELKAYRDKYKDTEANITALSRLAFLNEDPAAVSKGDDYGIEQFFSSAAESLYEARSGKDYKSDKDFRQRVIPLLEQEGIKLTEEQLDAATSEFSEELGEVAGVSADIGIDIALTKGILSTLGKATKLSELPTYLSRYKYIRESPKLIKFMDGAMEAITEGIAFEMASDETSFFMGLAEGGSAQGFKALGKVLTKGKYGKFFNYINTYATRVASQTTARTVGGTVEEYSGDWADQGVKNGFFTKEQYKNTFGEGEEGFKKFLLTAALSGGMGLPVSFISAMKKEAANNPGGDLAQAVDAYENQQSEAAEVKKLDDMSPEELTKYAEENDIDLEEKQAEEEAVVEEVKEILTDEDLEKIEKTLTPEEQIIEETNQINQKQDGKEKTETETKDETENKDGVLDESTEEEAVVNTEEDTISEEQIEEIEEIESIPEEDRTVEENKTVLETKVTPSQKKVSKISKALKKIAPDVKFVLHKTKESYDNSSKSDVSDTRGYRDGNMIHINVSESLDNTTFHEAIHPVLDAVFAKNPEVYNKLVSSMKSDPDFKDYMDNATADYTGENTQVNEALTEMMADVASGKFDAGSSVYEKVKDFVKEVLTKLNLRASDFNIDLSKEVDVRQFANTVGLALSKGKELTFEKEGKLVQEKIADAISKGKEFSSIFSEVISEGKDSFYQKVNNTSEITSEGISKATKKADKIVDNFYDKVKNKISKKALNIYKNINKTSKITKDGLLKASIKSKEFLEELSKNLDIASQKIYDSYKKSISYLKAASIGAGMILAADQAVIPSIKGYNQMGTQGALYEVIKSNKWVVDALEGTGVGNTLKSALGRLEFKYGDIVGGESVTVKEANEGSEVVKSVEDISTEDNVSPELRKFIAKNTTFKISDKKIPLYRSGKRVGETAHIQNQFPADSGFIYSASPTVGSVKNKPFSADGSAVAQFQLDGSVSDEQTYEGDESDYTKGVPGHYMHKNNDAILKVAKQRNDYVPVFEKLGDNKVRVKYKRFNELEKGERIMSPLRQFKFSDIAWGQETQASDFAKGMKALPLKKGVKYPYPGKKGGNQTDIIFGSTYKNPKTGRISKGSDRYGLYEGIGAVFIFKDNNNITWVREFNGSANQVAAKGREIIKQFNVKPEDLTVGYHDVGSYSARPLAKKGKVSTDSYTGKNEYNKKDETGGALYYPPIEVNFQKKGKGSKINLQSKADTLADKSKKEYDKQKKSGKNTEEAAKETFRKVFKNTPWYNKLSKEDKATVEADFNNRLVEQFENPSPKKNQVGKPPKSKDTSDKVVTTKMKELKEKWKNQDKGITEGKREALKTVKESQAEFQKDLNEVTKYLSESKLKRAGLLLRNVKDQKTLGEARTKLDELVSDKTVYVTAKESEIDEQLKKAEKAAEKNLTIEQRKRLKEIAKELKGRIKGKVNLRTAIQLTRKLAGLDPFNVAKVAEFRDLVEKTVNDVEYAAKKTAAKNLQSKIISKLKSINKQAGKSKLGIRQAKATELSKLDINRVEDLDAFNEIAEKVLQSLSNKQVSFSEVSKKLDSIIEDTNIKTKNFNEEVAKEQEAKIKEEYENSPMKNTMSFEKYKEIVESIRKDELEAKREAELEESQEELRSWVANRIDVVKSNLDSITSGMTESQKAIIKTLIKAKDIISNNNIVGVKSLAKINQALDEIITYNSTSGVGIIDVELEALRASVSLARTLKGKLDPGNFLAKKAKGFMKIVSNKSNLTQFFKGITKGGEAMRNVAQKTVAKFESGFKDAKVLHKKFNTALMALSDALDIKEKQSIRIGIISRLEQNATGLTEEESNLDLEEKITAIKNEIKTLKSNKQYKSDRRMGAKLEKAFNSLNLGNVKTKQDLKSKLTENENKFLDFAKEEFAKIKESYQETYRNSYGKELEIEDNYLPTFARRKGESKKDINSSSYSRTMDSDAQGRSVKRVKTDMSGATVYNYDIKRTASEGYYQTQYDINTLRERQVLNSLINAPVFKDLLMGRNQESPTGSHIDLYEEFVDRMKTLAGKRKSSTSLTEAEKSKLNKVSSRIGRALIALPLKDVTQFIKQPAAIIVNTLLRHPATTIQAFGDVSKMILSANIPGATQTEETKAIISLLGEGNTKLRDTMGDLDFKNAEAIIENLTNLTPKKMKRIINALGSGSLGEADMIATQGNWMANYRSFRRKQEGSGFKFDIIEEAKNPNADAVTAANLAADEVNNVSDSTTKNQDNTAVLNTLFFLFKSFSINQTIHTYLDIKNAFKSDSKSDKIEATKALAGSLTSIMAFVAVKQYILNKGIDSIMNEFFGELDNEDEDEEKGVLSFLAEGLSEMFMGGSPDDIMWAAKEGVNYISDKVSEDEVFKIYSSKAGVVGLGTSYFKDFVDDLDILFGNNEFKEDGRTYEMDYSSSMKKAAVADLVGILTQWGNMKRVGEKTKKAIKKREK